MTPKKRREEKKQQSKENLNNTLNIISNHAKNMPIQTQKHKNWHIINRSLYNLLVTIQYSIRKHEYTHIRFFKKILKKKQNYTLLS